MEYNLKNNTIMPNWAFTTHIVKSNKKEDVQDLYNKMKELSEREESLVENDFGKTWLGNLVTLLGGKWNEIYCRGKWIWFSLDNGILKFETETAWGEMDEFRHFIESKYPGMKIYYMSEEPGMEYYVTNDKEGKYFKYRFKVEVENEEIAEYTTREEAVEYIEELIERKLMKDESPNEALNEWAEKQGKDYASFYEYEIVEG